MVADGLSERSPHRLTRPAAALLDTLFAMKLVLSLTAVLSLVALIALSPAACSQQLSPPPPTGGVGGTGAVRPPPIGGSGGTAGTGGGGGTAGAGGSAGAGGTGGIGGVGGVAGFGGFGGALCELNFGGMGGMAGVAGGGGFGGFIGTACINPDDLEVIEDTEQNLRWHAARCATERCSPLEGQPQQFVDCVTRCVQSRAFPSDQLSDTCGCCYGRLARCAGVSCNTGCANTVDACTPACTGEVLCGGTDYAACLDVLNDCTGRNSLDCSEP